MTGVSALVNYVRLTLVFSVLSAAGCSIEDRSPTSPTQPTTPTRISGTITNTLTSAVVGSFSSDATTLPTRVSVAWPGYVTREAWVRSATPTVDLIQDAAPFSLAFYRQLVRNGFEAPAALEPVRILTQAPSLYLQRAGLTESNVTRLVEAARAVVPALTGGRFSVATVETGLDARAPLVGWIMVTLVNEPDATACGRAIVGMAAGAVTLNTAARCQFAGDIINPGTLAHELGHALGFWHTEAGPLMKAVLARSVSMPSDAERHHAAIAYHRTTGNTDVDVDPAGSAALGTSRVID